jgi:hypothetical protein
MSKVVASMSMSPDGYVADANDGVGDGGIRTSHSDAAVSAGAALGGYPYRAASPGPCSVRQNRRVEEENA